MPKAIWLLLLALPLFADELGDQLLAATRKGDVAAVKQLLDQGADVNAKTRYNSTPLFFACDRGHLEVAKLLIERGANLNVKDNFYNASALSWAMSKKHDAIVELLIDKGVNPSDAMRDAVQNGNMKLFRTVLDRGTLNKPLLDESLMMAQLAKREEMAKMLEAAGAKKIDYPVDAATLESYAGKYTEGEMTLTFGIKDGKLTFTQGQGGGANLISAAKDKFKFLQAGIDFKFNRDAAGAVESVSFNGRGGDMTIKKASTTK
jgi:uncharacterized protein